MVLSDEADAGMAFDAVYSTAHADRDTKSHFISPASMVLEAGVNEAGRTARSEQRPLALINLHCPVTPGRRRLLGRGPGG